MDAAISNMREFKYIKNFRSNRYLFRIYNANRPEHHSANKIFRDEEELPYAVHCNCGKFHPVILDIDSHKDEYNAKRTKIEWLVEDSNLENLIKKVKLMWLKEGI